MKAPWFILISVAFIAALAFYFSNATPLSQKKNEATLLIKEGAAIKNTQDTASSIDISKRKIDNKSEPKFVSQDQNSIPENSTTALNPSVEAELKNDKKVSESVSKITESSANEPNLNLKGTSEAAKQFMLKAREGNPSKTLEAARKFYEDSNGSFASKKAYLGSLLNVIQDQSISNETRSQIWEELVQALRQAQEQSDNNAQEYQLYTRVGFAATAMYYKEDFSKIDSYVRGVDNKKSQGYGFFLQAAVSRKKGEIAESIQFLEEAIKINPLTDYKQALAALKKDPNSSPFKITLSLEEEELKEN